MNDMEEKRDNKGNQGTPAPYRPWKLHGSMGGTDREGKPRRYLGRDDGYGPKSGTRSAMILRLCERDCHVRRTSPSLSTTKVGTRCCETERTGTLSESFPSLDEACNEGMEQGRRKCFRMSRTKVSGSGSPNSHSSRSARPKN